jgi:hypothetical protein
MILICSLLFTMSLSYSARDLLFGMQAMKLSTHPDPFSSLVLQMTLVQLIFMALLAIKDTIHVDCIVLLKDVGPPVTVHITQFISNLPIMSLKDVTTKTTRSTACQFAN